MGSIFAAMRRCQLFDGIPEEKYQNVLNCLHGEVRAIPKDTILLRIGDCQKRPGVVMSGTLRISLYSEDGNLLTIDRLSRGRVFGETLVCSMSQDSPIQIDALNDTEVLYLDFDPLLLQQENGCPYRMRVTQIRTAQIFHLLLAVINNRQNRCKALKLLDLLRNQNHPKLSSFIRCYP